jgi:translocator protein
MHMIHSQSSSFPNQQSHTYLKLAGWIVLVLGLGSAVGILFGPDLRFYALAKPTWNPPNWVFAPVWTVLYVLMGISVWLVRRNDTTSRTDITSAMLLFWLQLALNLIWTPIFFGLHMPALAFMEICLLWLVALFTALAFGKISSSAGYLLVPYLAWLSFALVLNGTIWLLN